MKLGSFNTALFGGAVSGIAAMTIWQALLEAFDGFLALAFSFVVVSLAVHAITTVTASLYRAELTRELDEARAELAKETTDDNQQ